MTLHNPDLNVNEEHFQQWMDLLRSGTLPQGRERLFSNTPYEESFGFCCLGAGCTLVPGLPIVALEFDVEHGVAVNEFPDLSGLPTGSITFGSMKVTDKAPAEFIEWLGLDAPYHENDLVPDFPPTLTAPNTVNVGALKLICTAAGMNDSGFTFSQIADVFSYFGIGGVDE